MELNKKQQEGLEIILDRWHKGYKYTVVSGAAGTGKSSLVKFAVAAMHVDPEDVVYATYTGKAADVLRKKGNYNVSTLHKLLYNTRQKTDGNYIYIPVSSIPYKVIIVDECSMVPPKMVTQLCNYPNVYIIFLGDEYQIPPVKDIDNNLLAAPHVVLEEIMRQEEGSGIIDVATAIRTGTPIRNGKIGNDAYIGSASELSVAMLDWADIVITFTNVKRIEMNNIIREHRGLTPGVVEEGEKIISLHNEWETITQEGTPLINGMLGTFHNFYETLLVLPKLWQKNNEIPYFHGTFINEEGEKFENINVDKNNIINGTYSLSGPTLYKLKHDKKLGLQRPFEFTYGYAITAWKAQGSEWDKVLVLEEDFPFGHMRSRALYTAVTRASKQLILLR